MVSRIIPNLKEMGHKFPNVSKHKFVVVLFSSWFFFFGGGWGGGGGGGQIHMNWLLSLQYWSDKTIMSVRLIRPRSLNSILNSIKRFFDTVSKTAVISLDYKSRIRMFSLNCLNTTSNLIRCKVCQKMKQIGFALHLPCSQGHSYLKWYKMLQVNGAWRHDRYEKSWLKL